MTEIEIKASRGEPYQVSRDDRGTIRLKRRTTGGRTMSIVFTRDDVIGVANAMIDVLEAGR